MLSLNRGSDERVCLRVFKFFVLIPIHDQAIIIMLLGDRLRFVEIHAVGRNLPHKPRTGLY